MKICTSGYHDRYSHLLTYLQPNQIRLLDERYVTSFILMSQPDSEGL